MKSDIQDITKRALKLLPGTRAYIAETLLEGLDFEADFPACAWRRGALVSP